MGHGTSSGRQNAARTQQPPGIDQATLDKVIARLVKRKSNPSDADIYRVESMMSQMNPGDKLVSTIVTNVGGKRKAGRATYEKTDTGWILHEALNPGVDSESQMAAQIAWDAWINKDWTWKVTR